METKEQQLMFINRHIWNNTCLKRCVDDPSHIQLRIERIEYFFEKNYGMKITDHPEYENEGVKWES